MTDHAMTLKHGDEYIVFYLGGPYDGRTDRRISTDGSWDTELTVLAAIDGKETQLVYSSPLVQQVGEQVQVHYTWKPEDGEDLEAPEERGEM